MAPASPSYQSRCAGQRRRYGAPCAVSAHGPETPFSPLFMVRVRFPLACLLPRHTCLAQPLFSSRSLGWHALPSRCALLAASLRLSTSFSCLFFRSEDLSAGIEEDPYSKPVWKDDIETHSRCNSSSHSAYGWNYYTGFALRRISTYPNTVARHIVPDLQELEVLTTLQNIYLARL